MENPQHEKPKIGKTPSFITNNTPIPASEAFAKFNSLEQAVLQDKKSLDYYRRDFIDSCISYADKFRVREQPQVEPIGEKVLEDCKKLKAIRDYLCNWVLLESDITDQSILSDKLINVLEKLIELKSKPQEINIWHNSWSEAHSVFVYETFLYIVAALLKSGAYSVLNDIYTSHYLPSLADRQYRKSNLKRFDCFRGYSETLQAVLAPEGRSLCAPAAELIKRQADREDIPFSDIQQAELLTLLMSFITPDTYWYPGTLHYSSYDGGYPFFVRAEQHKDYLNLAKITGIESVDELREKIKEGHKRVDVGNWYDFHSDSSFWYPMNMDKLDRLK